MNSSCARVRRPQIERNPPQSKRSYFSRLDFLSAMFGAYYRENKGFVSVSISSHLSHRSETRFFPGIELLAKAEFLEDKNVLFRVCPTESMKPSSNAVPLLPAFWAGVDLRPNRFSGKEYFKTMQLAARAVRCFPLRPSIIVESGTGLHLYWLLRRAIPIVDVSAAERIIRRIQLYFACDKTVGLDSRLRLPGTHNNGVADGPVEMCVVKFINNEFRYDLEDFRDCVAKLEALEAASNAFGDANEL
jgi:hypothetical protein